MENPNFNDLVRNAWELYRLTQDVQKLLNTMFFDQFVDLDKELEGLCIQQEELPF